MAKTGLVYDVIIQRSNADALRFNGIQEVGIVPSTPPLVMLGNSLGVSVAIVPLGPGDVLLYENGTKPVELLSVGTIQ